MTRRPDRRSLGRALVVAGALVYALVLAVSAATAPPLVADSGEGFDAALGESTAPTPAGEDRTSSVLVGLQGPFSGREGRVVLVDGNETTWQGPEVWAHFDATPLGDGRLLAAFLERGREDCGPYDSPCSRTGFRVLDTDGEPTVVREWTFPVRSHVNSEVHDVEPLPSGEVLVADMEQERVVTVDEEGAVTWEWRAERRYDAPADPTREDWLHINDVDRIGPGRFLVSVRNANQLLILERGRGVVEVINEDGDPSVLDHQHNPQWLGDGRVLVADSENDRVVELARVEGSWEPVWTVDSAGGVPFAWPRDADRLPNGNTLVTDSLNDRVVVVNRSGGLVWSASPGRIPYEADPYPGGEPVGAATGTATDEDRTPTDGGTPSVETADAPASAGGIPVVSSLLWTARGVVPVPHWVSEWHVLALLGTLVVEAVGGWLWYAGE